MSTLRTKTTQGQQPVATAAKTRSTHWQTSGEFATEADYWAEVARLTRELQQLRKEGYA